MSSAPKSGVRICYITVPDQLAADSLSNALVKNKLAACVNVIPGIKSTYLWEGKINNDFVRVPHIPLQPFLVEACTASRILPLWVLPRVCATVCCRLTSHPPSLAHSNRIVPCPGTALDGEDTGTTDGEGCRLHQGEPPIR